jgi:SAM-dependent methyltransferase
MKPDDLVEFSRQTYAKPNNVEGWADDALVDSGLSADELELLEAYPGKSGDLLLLGVGGGREAIPLARLGFRVTGVDYVAEMVDRAKQNAISRGVTLDGLEQEISRLDLPANNYDLVWLSRAMYSCVPTRERRVEMVRRIAQTLKPGGYFLCQFHWDPQMKYTARSRFVRRLITVCTLGNFAYEEGDILWLNVEFIHAFATQDAIRSEIDEGGLSVLRIKTSPSSACGSAVCIKNHNPGMNG